MSDGINENIYNIFMIIIIIFHFLFPVSTANEVISLTSPSGEAHLKKQKLTVTTSGKKPDPENSNPKALTETSCLFSQSNSAVEYDGILAPI